MKIALEDKVFFVTGAASGIGAAATEILAASGAKVAACDRDKERLESMWQGKNAIGTVVPISADVAQQHHVQQRVVLAVLDGLAAELHDHDLAVEALDVRQRLDEDLGALFDWKRHVV